MQGQYVVSSPPSISAMDSSSFDGLVARLRKASFADKKLQEVELCVRGQSFFTSAQAASLVAEIKGDKEQVEGCVLLWPRVLDSWNFGEAVTSLTFPSSRDTVLKRIWDVPPFFAQNYPNSLDEPSFAKLCVRLTKKCNFAQQKYDEVRLAVHGGAFFSSSQARVCVSEIKSDKEQVEGCFLLWPRVVDSWNFGEAIAALTFPSSRDTLLKRIWDVPPFFLPYFSGGNGVALDEDSFNKLVVRLKKCNFAQQKYDEVRLAVHGRALFSSHQAKVCVAEVKSDKEQVDACILIYPKVTDVEMFTDVINALTFASSKDKVLKSVQSLPKTTTNTQPHSVGYNPNVGYNNYPPQHVGYNNYPPPQNVGYNNYPQNVGYGYFPPAPTPASSFSCAPPSTTSCMCNDDFNKMIQQLKSVQMSDKKVSHVKLATQGGALFSSEQARQILLCIHGDNEQQEIALLLYPRVIDPANFGQALSAVKFSTTKDQILKRIIH